MKMLIGLATFWDVAPFWADGPNPKFAIKKMKNRKKGRRKKKWKHWKFNPKSVY